MTIDILRVVTMPSRRTCVISRDYEILRYCQSKNHSPDLVWQWTLYLSCRRLSVLDSVQKLWSQNTLSRTGNMNNLGKPHSIYITSVGVIVAKRAHLLSLSIRFRVMRAKITRVCVVGQSHLNSRMAILLCNPNPGSIFTLVYVRAQT